MLTPACSDSSSIPCGLWLPFILAIKLISVIGPPDAGKSRLVQMHTGNECIFPGYLVE